MLKICREYVSHLVDGDIRLWINVVHQIFHPADLKTVDHKVDHCLIGIRVIPFGVDCGNAVFKRLRQGFTNIRGFGCNNECRLGSVKAFHEEVHRLGGCGISYNGIQRQDPASDDNAAYYVQ